MENQSNNTTAPQEEQNRFLDYKIDGLPFLEQGEVYKKPKYEGIPIYTKDKRPEKSVRKSINIF